MIVLFGGEKGGVGKTTIATNVATYLSIQGDDVVLVDADSQESTAKWVARRNEFYPEEIEDNGQKKYPKIHISIQRGNIFEAIKDLSTRYQHVIIDAGGRDSDELRSAVVVSQKSYFPLRPSKFDIETSETINDIVKTAKGFNPAIEAYALINFAPTNLMVTEARDAANLLKDLDQLKLTKQMLRDRKAYRDAAEQGISVVEYSGNKGKAEIQLLCQEIFDL